MNLSLTLLFHEKNPKWETEWESISNNLDILIDSDYPFSFLYGIMYFYVPWHLFPVDTAREYFSILMTTEDVVVDD